MMHNSRSKNRIDESSGDELAETALLYNVPSLPNQPVRLPSIHSLGAIATEDIIRPQTSKSDPGLLDKPLPPMPPKDPFAPFAEQRRHWKNRPALGTKTTNMKVLASPGKRSVKPNISSPIQLDQSNTAFPNASRPTTSHTMQSNFSAPTTTANAAELSRKISNLMQQAAAQEAQTKQKAAIYEAESAKVSPLERSRNAIVKATRAIKGKLSNSSNNSTVEKPLNPNRRMSTRPSLSSEIEPAPHYQSQEDLRERLERRIAEGRNLSNPKVQSMTGNGHIPRKPLPVYESMKSRSLRSKSAEDPFLDNTEPERCLCPQDYSGFDFDFSKHKHKNKAKSKVSATNDDGHAGGPPSSPRPAPGFSNMVSGLAQHPDTMVFSSPPVATSTPQILLEPAPSADANKPNRDTLVRRQFVLDSTFEAQSGESSPEKKAHRPTASDGSTLSVKRKEATRDLRSGSGSTPKKAKTESITSQESLGLTLGISQLEAGDERVPLSPKSTKTRVGLSNINESKARRGLSIFDVLAKGKGVETSEDDGVKKSRTRSNVTKRSSFSRPSSTLFSRGRESRAGMQRLHSYGGDDMDVDELQTDDVAYQVRGMKK